MKTKLSGLMDGELAEHEAHVVFAALRDDPELRNHWQEYQLIGDALKGERNLNVELTGSVMAALEAEPTVLAPRSSSPRREAWRRNLMALAATLAGVAVVGWLALGSSQSPQPENVALNAPAQLAVATARNEGAALAVRDTGAVPAVRQASVDMQEYLIAHEAQSSLLEFRGGAEHIRTVAAVGMAPAK
jgi:sigma-E factor negative regulatory protein RseA